MEFIPHFPQREMAQGAARAPCAPHGRGGEEGAPPRSQPAWDSFSAAPPPSIPSSA